MKPLVACIVVVLFLALEPGGEQKTPSQLREGVGNQNQRALLIFPGDSPRLDLAPGHRLRLAIGCRGVVGPLPSTTLNEFVLSTNADTMIAAVCLCQMLIFRTAFVQFQVAQAPVAF